MATQLISSDRLQFTKNVKIPMPWGGYLAAKIWGPDDGMPVLAFHGWQDNAGTYDTLAPLLPNSVCLICLDFCGHGWSPYYPINGILLHSYYDHLYHIKLVIDHFKLKKVTIMGHSMGANIALMFTLLHPDLVEKLISIDAVKQQITITNELPPKRLKKALTQFQEISTSLERGRSSTPMTYNEARDKLIRNSGGSLNEKDADILLIRGLKKKGDQQADQWEYSRDLRTIIRPPHLSDLTFEQAKAVARGITCPFLLIIGKQSNLPESEFYEEFFDIYRNSSRDFRLVKVDEGRHHVHLSKPELVAPFLIDFLFSSSPSKL